MHKTIAIAVALATLGLAGCGDTDAKRGVSGGAIGAVGASVLGADPVVGAAVGAAAGVFCDDIAPNTCG